MSKRFEAKAASAFDDRVGRVHLERKTPPGEREVDLRKCFEAGGELRPHGGDRLREPLKDPFDFAYHGEFGLLQAIVEIDHCLGFDEQCGARARGVVHDASHLAAMIRAHGQHIAVVAHREIRIGEGLLDVALLQVATEASLQL